jgi:prepilin-type N-terminal cleavage/methylation domain-containing protein
MSGKLFDGEAGFTLLEVLIAILIFTIGMLGTLTLTAGVVRGNFFSRNVTSATTIAQKTIEGAQRAGYAGVSAYVSDSTKVPASISVGGVSFSQTAAVANGAPAAGLKSVAVTVSWNEAHTSPHLITLETILAE